jgi:hypothetical protein
MCNFVLLEGGAQLLLLGVDELMIELVLGAVEKLKGLRAARTNLSLDSNASNPLETLPTELDVDVLGIDPIQLEFSENGRIGTGRVMTACGSLGFNVIIVSAYASLVCHSSISFD